MLLEKQEISETREISTCPYCSGKNIVSVGNTLIEWNEYICCMIGRIVNTFYNLGVLLIAAGAFKQGIDLAIGVAIGVLLICIGFTIDIISEKKKNKSWLLMR